MESNKHNQILASLQKKSVIKQKVYDNTFEVFNMLKELLHDLNDELNEELENGDRRIKLEYRDRGKFEAEIKFASDVLIFSMHSNVFEFDREHAIWKSDYIKSDKENSYCGVISIYNFLADSFRLNRLSDLGYLVGRIFVNKENHYFVEGKRQTKHKYAKFAINTVNKENLIDIVESAILYTLNFDLLVPPYDAVKIATVEQLNTKIESSKMRTGKRIGFQYNSDDVLDINE